MTALLDLKGVSLSFGGLEVLSSLDLHVDEGEIVSVIGPNGAGKTTLFNLITGIYRPHGGDILLDGRSISRSSRRMPGVRSIERKTPARVWPYAAAITFSFTVRFRNRRSVWNVRAMPRPVILCGSRPTSVWPSKRMSPSSGW